MMENEKKLFLLDAMALIYRAYFALARSPRLTSTGRNTNAQFGFTNTLNELLNKEKPSHLAVVFEGGKSDTDVHRTNIYADYKANRQEQPEDIRNSLPDIRRIVEGFSLPCLSSEGYEADDVIGTLALEAAALGYTVYMVTPDKDYGQLVREKVLMYKPGYMGNPSEVLGEAEICAKWNIKRVDQVIDMLGLMGDAVDNIPGIAGVGEKTASKLLGQYDTLEGVLANAHEIKGAMGEKVRQGHDMAILSKQLATIITDVPIKFHEKNFRVEEWDRPALEAVFAELEFKSLGTRILAQSSAPDAPVAVDLFGHPIQSRYTKAPGLTSAPTEEMPAAAPPEMKTLETTQHAYKLVQGEAQIEELIGRMMAQTEISFDTETTGKDANLAQLVGLSFSWQAGAGYYVPLSQNQEEAAAVLALFSPLFARQDVLWIGQNIKYDLLMLRWAGHSLAGNLYDTMLAHYLFEPDGKRNMEALSEKYLHYTPVSIETLIGKNGKNQLTMADVDVETVKEYAAEDADITLQLKQSFDPEIVKMGVEKLFRTVETPLVKVLTAMEHEGVGIDVPFLENYSTELDTDIKTAEAKIYQIAGVQFNLGSPKQLGEILFDKLKIEGGGKKTKTGQYATGEDVLQRLASKHPIMEDILTYRQLSKLKSTYVDALPQLINPRSGRVHTCFNQTVAVTGRLSSNNPNLQNIPIRTDRGREIRRAFIGRGEGWTLLSADYSQIELRIIASLSNDAGMIEAFQSGVDVHTATASKVYGVAIEAVDSNMRRNAKAVNFGIIYGQSAFGLADKLNISRTEAKEIIENYFQQYPGIKNYIDSQIRTAREQQYVETMLGRKRHLRDINSANQTVRGFAERNAVNMPIQGSAADMIKLAMIDIHQALESEKLQTRMVLQVHDELIFDVPESEVEQASILIKTRMEAAMELPNGVPVVAEPGTGANWLEAH